MRHFTQPSEFRFRSALFGVGVSIILLGALFAYIGRPIPSMCVCAFGVLLLIIHDQVVIDVESKNLEIIYPLLFIKKSVSLASIDSIEIVVSHGATLEQLPTLVYLSIGTQCVRMPFGIGRRLSVLRDVLGAVVPSVSVRERQELV